MKTFEQMRIKCSTEKIKKFNLLLLSSILLMNCSGVNYRAINLLYTERLTQGTIMLSYGQHYKYLTRMRVSQNLMQYFYYCGSSV